MDLPDRGHAGMADRYGLGAELDGGESRVTPDGVLFAFRSDIPGLNGAIPLGGDAHALIASARRFFGERGRGFSFFTRSEAERQAAVNAGLDVLSERRPAMVLRRPLAEPRGVLLRQVATEAEAHDYLGVIDRAFSDMPAGILAAFPASMLIGEATVAFVAYLHDKPVAAASVVLAQGIGGIQWVGVLDEARGRGLAALCTAKAANAGFEMGADCAWLEASRMGERVYLRMGFEEMYAYRIYVAPAPAA